MMGEVGNGGLVEETGAKLVLEKPKTLWQRHGDRETCKQADMKCR